MDMFESLDIRVQQVEQYIKERASSSNETPKQNRNLGVPTPFQASVSPAKSPVSDRTPAPEVQDSPWRKTLEHLTIGYFEKAYSTMLQHGDSIQLIRLMEKTGSLENCLSSLRPSN